MIYYGKYLIRITLPYRVNINYWRLTGKSNVSSIQIIYKFKHKYTILNNRLNERKNNYNLY